MNPTDATSLYGLCTELLDACAAAVALAPAGPISRRFVAPGMPAFDCPDDQLTVHAGGPQQAQTLPLEPPLQPGYRPIVGHVNLVTVTTTVTRCTPTVRESGGRKIFPTVDALDASAQEILGDVWTIWNHLATVKRNGTLFPPDHRAMIFEPAVPLATSGGVAGWEIVFRVQLDGYPTVTA